MSTDSMWDKVSEVPQSGSPGARWQPSRETPVYSFVERMRVALPEAEESPEATALLKRQYRGPWQHPAESI